MSEPRTTLLIELIELKLPQVSGLQCITRAPEGSAIDHLG